MTSIVIGRTSVKFSLSAAAVQRLHELGDPLVDQYIDYLGSVDYESIGRSIYRVTVENHCQMTTWEDFDKEHNGSRASHYLVQTVRELGDAANGYLAQLKVVDIPDDVKWHIGSDDFGEWVAEDHRTWGFDDAD